MYTINLLYAFPAPKTSKNEFTREKKLKRNRFDIIFKQTDRIAEIKRKTDKEVNASLRSLRNKIPKQNGPAQVIHTRIRSHDRRHTLQSPRNYYSKNIKKNQSTARAHTLAHSHFFVFAVKRFGFEM